MVANGPVLHLILTLSRIGFCLCIGFSVQELGCVPKKLPVAHSACCLRVGLKYFSNGDVLLSSNGQPQVAVCGRSERFSRVRCFIERAPCGEPSELRRGGALDL